MKPRIWAREDEIRQDAELAAAAAMAVDARIAAQMAGYVDYRLVGAADHPITQEEHDLACEIGYELAKRHGLNLAQAVAAQRAREIAYGRVLGIF